MPLGNIAWTDIVDCIVDGPDIRQNQGLEDWHAGAVSIARIPALGSGKGLQFTLGGGSPQWDCGFGSDATALAYSDFWFELGDDGHLIAYEAGDGGNSQYDYGTITGAETFSIVLNEQGKVDFKVNGAIVYTSLYNPVADSFPMQFYCAIEHISTPWTLTNVQIDTSGLAFNGGIEINEVLRGKAPSERDEIMRGVISEYLGRYEMLAGSIGGNSDREEIFKGKDFFEASEIVNPRPLLEIREILTGIEALPIWKTKRLSLSDPLNLRTTAVYRAPRDISVLKVVYGDLMNSKIPCTALDKDGYMHHVSDRPMQLIDSVFVEGEPVTSGFRAMTAYQDETGQGIACVIFDNPQYDKKVSVSGKGAVKLDTGELIENPADLIRDIFLNIQGYGETSIDSYALSQFYADGLHEEIKVATILDSVVTIKNFLDELALNIHSQWMISDGKSVMRYRWL